jgi:hypothetical protein
MAGAMGKGEKTMTFLGAGRNRMPHVAADAAVSHHNIATPITSFASIPWRLASGPILLVMIIKSTRRMFCRL